MDLKEMRSRSAEELATELSALYKAGFSLRMQHGTQQLNNSSQLRRNRRDVARVKTLIREKAGA